MHTYIDTYIHTYIHTYIIIVNCTIMSSMSILSNINVATYKHIWAPAGNTTR